MKTYIVVTATIILLLLVILTLGLSLIVANKELVSVKSENVQLLEDQSTRAGGLEIEIEKPELKEKFIPAEGDPSFFPLPYTQFLRETSPYKTRFSPITNDLVHHLGWDICGHAKSEVYSAGDGKIVDLWIPGGMKINGIRYRGHDTRDGYIVIDHGNIITTYSHLSEVYVYNIGAIVTEGQTLGRTGAGGLSTGDHLHFEAIDKETGEFMNPVELFPYVHIDKNGRIWFVEDQPKPISTF